MIRKAQRARELGLRRSRCARGHNAPVYLSESPRAERDTRYATKIIPRKRRAANAIAYLFWYLRTGATLFDKRAVGSYSCRWQKVRQRSDVTIFPQNSKRELEQ